MKKKIHIKARMNNKAFWVAILSGVALIFQALGIVTIPDNWDIVVNGVLSAFVAMGILVDTSTEGIYDK